MTIEWTNYSGEFLTFIASYYYDLRKGFLDNTLISDRVDVSLGGNSSLAFDAFYSFSNRLNIVDEVFTLGTRREGEPDLTLLDLLDECPENTFPAAGDRDFSTQIRLGDLLREDDESPRLWWRFAARIGEFDTHDLAVAELHSFCYTADCPTKTEWANHGQVRTDDYHAIGSGGSTSNLDLVSCLSVEEAEHYLKGVRAELFTTSTEFSPMQFRIFISDNTPGEPPAEDSLIWQKDYAPIPMHPATPRADFICAEKALEAVNPKANVCFGVRLHRNPKNGMTEVAYRDVGKGNSHSYRRADDGDWVSMDDKEFFFTLVTETDCDQPPSTTIPTGTTTTTREAVCVTTSTTITTSTTTTTIPVPATLRIVEEPHVFLDRNRRRFVATLRNEYVLPSPDDDEAFYSNIEFFNLAMPSTDFTVEAVGTAPDPWDAKIVSFDGAAPPVVYWIVVDPDSTAHGLGPSEEIQFTFDVSVDNFTERECLWYVDFNFAFGRRFHDIAVLENYPVFDDDTDDDTVDDDSDDDTTNDDSARDDADDDDDDDSAACGC
ncbi:hypothetical protein KDL45_01100 [bacterium]|nr:hypothetical protein [bacterium]